MDNQSYHNQGFGKSFAVIFFATFFNSYRAALYLSFENEIKQIIEKDN